MSKVGFAPGKELESIIATLERILAGAGAVIEAPSRSLFDRDTNSRREFDVLITWKHHHHQPMTAIECRDKSRPVSVNAVQEFATKCADAGVHYGVIVSTSGFSGNARAKAKAKGIICMDFKDVAGFDWLPITIEGRQANFSRADIRICGNGLPSKIETIFDGEGKPISEQELRSL